MLVCYVYTFIIYSKEVQNRAMTEDNIFRMLGNIEDIVKDTRVDLSKHTYYAFTPEDFLALYFCRIETGEGVTYEPRKDVQEKTPLQVIEEHVFGGY